MGCSLSGNNNVEPITMVEEAGNLILMFHRIKTYIEQYNRDKNINPETEKIVQPFLDSFPTLMEILKKHYDSHKDNKSTPLSPLQRKGDVLKHDLCSSDNADAGPSQKKRKTCGDNEHTSTDSNRVNKHKDSRISQLTGEVQKKEEIIMHKNAQIEDLSSRLAQEMGKKLSANEGAVENVSIRNRPMNIAEDYQQFCSNEWLDAKGYLDGQWPNHTEEEKLRLLCHILMVSEKQCSYIHDKVLDKTTGSIRNMPIFEPIKFGTGDKLQEISTQSTEDILSKEIAPQSADDMPAVPLELSNAVRDYMRKNSDRIQYQGLVKAIKHELKEEKSKSSDSSFLSLWPKKRKNDALAKYMKKSAQLVWNMAIQTPKMEFKTTGENEIWMGEKYQEPYWNSDDPSGDFNKVTCYAYPMLYQGSVIMTKGKVFIKRQSTV